MKLTYWFDNLEKIFHQNNNNMSINFDLAAYLNGQLPTVENIEVLPEFLALTDQLREGSVIRLVAEDETPLGKTILNYEAMFDAVVLLFQMAEHPKVKKIYVI